MTSPEARRRTVIFRLTEREYALLRKVCSREKRSLSEFTRVELLAAIQGRPEAGGSQMEAELSRVRTALEELKELVLCLKSRRNHRPDGKMHAG